MANKLTYQSLRRRSDFLRLQQQGAKVSPRPWMLINFQENPEGAFRCGWTYPRYVGSAVVRNRLKRWSREFFREQEALEKGLDLNVVLRRQDKGFYKNVSHQEFKQALQDGYQRVRKRSGQRA